jgi:O-antigen ligase
LLAANLVWTTLCLGGYLPRTMVLSMALTVAALAVTAIDWAPARGRTSLHPAGWWLLPFLLYAAANVAWVTPVRWLGWIEWCGWAQMIATFWIVLNGVRHSALRRGLFLLLAGLAVVAVVMAGYQRFVRSDWLMLGKTQSPQYFPRTSGPFGIPNSLGAFLILLLPPCGAWVFRRGAGAAERVLFGWLTLVFALGLGLTISRGAWIGLALALVAWPLLAGRWPLRRRLTIAAASLGGIALLGGAIFFSSPLARQRFSTLARETGERTRPVMWRAAVQIFREHPALGSGAASYNVLFERHRPPNEQWEPRWAHNEYLNTLSDYGVVGFVLFFGGCVAIAWRTSRASPSHARTNPKHSGARGLAASDRRESKTALDDPSIQRALGVGLLAFAFQIFVDFHFKIPALAMIFATLSALVVGSRWPVASPTDPAVAPGPAKTRARLFGFAMATGVIAFGAWFVVPRFHAEGIRDDWRWRLNDLSKHSLPPPEKRDLAMRAEEAFTRAIEIDSGNAQAWADRAYAAAIVGHEMSVLAGRRDVAHESELGRQAENDARAALARSPIVPEFWLRLGVALDMQNRWLEAGNAFSEALKLAPMSAPAWFYHAFHLSLNPVTMPLARSAVATCLRLDPLNPEADALRRQLAAGQ